MALIINTDAVTGVTCLQADGKLTELAKGMGIALVGAGISEITEENAAEVYMRIHAIETLGGKLFGGKDPELVTLAEVRQHTGLRINAHEEPLAEWWYRIRSSYKSGPRVSFDEHSFGLCRHLLTCMTAHLETLQDKLGYFSSEHERLDDRRYTLTERIKLQVVNLATLVGEIEQAYSWGEPERECHHLDHHDARRED